MRRANETVQRTAGADLFLVRQAEEDLRQIVWAIRTEQVEGRRGGRDIERERESTRYVRCCSIRKRLAKYL